MSAVVAGVMTVLDWGARILVIAVPVAGLITFLARRWLGGMIDAHFKRQVEKDIKDFDHKFTAQLEAQKAEAARSLATEVENLRATLSAGLERGKRELDEEFRRRAKFFDTNVAYYEAFQTGYGSIFVDIYALDGATEPLNQITAGLGDQLRKQNVLRIMSIATDLQSKLSPFEAYIETEYKLRASQLYSKLIDFLVNDAKDRSTLDELNQECSLLKVELKNSVMGSIA
jgi:hypothetical protein